MIVAREVEDTRSVDIKSDIIVVSQLIKKMAGVCPFIAAASIISAAHVGAHTDALIRPALPLTKGIEADRNNGRFNCQSSQREEKIQNDNCD